MRNLAALRTHGWGMMIGPGSHGGWSKNYTHLAGDNGAWTCYQTGRPWDANVYDRWLERVEKAAYRFDFLVLPDIVAGGLDSLALSVRYLNRCLGVAPLVLIAVQDGMEPADLAPFVGPNVGIFLGGSTAWKLARMADWGQFCRIRDIHYHVGRVNTCKRMFAAIAAGADSVDGSSVSRYAITAPHLTYASRQGDLFRPAASANK